MYLVCQKRRKIVRRKQDGSSRECHKCAHGMATTYGKEVDESVCEGCVLRVVTINRSTCNPKPPSNPVYAQPTYGQDGEIRYEPVGAEPPDCPEGYTRRNDDAWIFDSEWFPCPYRVFNDDLKPDGSLQVRGYCTVSNKKVDSKECEQCKGELAQLGGSLEVEVPQTPAIAQQFSNYWKAVKKWITAGRPVRSDSDVRKIHANFCLACDWYDHGSRRCKGCGCKIKPKGKALLNKAKMATEHCPRDFW